MAKEAKAFEILAARIVVSQTGGSFAPLDPGGGPESLADFRLADDHGNDVGLLEVTSVVDPNLNALITALHGPTNRVPRQLSNSSLCWHVDVEADAIRVNEVRGQLTPILEAIEAITPGGSDTTTGWQVLDPANRQYVDNGLPPDLNELLYELHVTRVVGWPGADAPGTVEYASVGVGGSLLPGPDAVTRAANEQLDMSDNLKKLRRAGSGLRAELFVWLDQRDVRIVALRTLTEDPLQIFAPTDAPTPPHGITAVWAAPTPTAEDTGVLWYSDGTTWQVRRWVLPRPATA